MATIKSYTTIEQSKHLVELGLDPRTADMFYATEMGVLIAEPPYEVEGHEPCVPFTPAWSLAALLELMPCPIILNGNFAYPIVNLFSKSITYDVGMAEYHKEEGYDLIDAAVKLVIWLIEQGHIKVNK